MCSLLVLIAIDPTNTTSYYGQFFAIFGYIFLLSLMSLDVSVPESAPVEEGRDGAEKSVHPDDDQGDEG
jgi:hypothetical protein